MSKYNKDEKRDVDWDIKYWRNCMLNPPKRIRWGRTFQYINFLTWEEKDQKFLARPIYFVQLNECLLNDKNIIMTMT